MDRNDSSSAAYLPPYLRPFSYPTFSPYSAVGYGSPSTYPLPYPTTSMTAVPSTNYFSHPLPSVSSIPTPSPTATPGDSDDEGPRSPPAKKARPSLPEDSPFFRPIDFNTTPQPHFPTPQLPPTPDSGVRSEEAISETASHTSSRGSSPGPQSFLVSIPRLTSSEHKEGDLTLTLLDSELWKSFHAVGNEMIVTKPGRRLFPSLLVSLKGLDPTTSYSISLRVVSADQYRYKFLSMHWVPVGESEVIQNEDRQIFHHPSSPNSGSFWMKKPISFKAVKITHNASSKNGNILLHTMHKYVMEVVVTSKSGSETVIQIPNTTFIAVTAYQNTKLTQLKIDNNPFAKGFRDRESAGGYVPGMPLPSFTSPYGPGSLWNQMPSLPPLPSSSALLPPPLVPASSLSSSTEEDPSSDRLAYHMPTVSPSFNTLPPYPAMQWPHSSLPKQERLSPDLYQHYPEI